MHVICQQVSQLDKFFLPILQTLAYKFESKERFVEEELLIMICSTHKQIKVEKEVKYSMKIKLSSQYIHVHVMLHLCWVDSD